MSNNIVGWMVWYDDGRRFSSKDREWIDLPVDGVMGIKLFESKLKGNGENQALILAGHDFYFKAVGSDGNPIYGADIEIRERNKLQEIRERYTDAFILRGKWASLEMMSKVSEQMRMAQWL